MNKIISSRLAISILVALSLVFILIVLFANRNTNYAMSEISPQIKKSTKEKCEVHAYTGNMNIRVWKIDNQDIEKTSLGIKKEDALGLPSENITTLQLVDSNQDIENKLASSSEDNPVEIKISGFANKCGELFFASVEYKDGIFKPYLYN